MYDIARAINPVPTPFEQQGQLNQLLAQRQQQQMGALELQQKQQDLKDQQAMTNAMHEWDGKDMSTLPGLVIKHGASAKAVMGLKSGILEQQQKFATIAKDGSEADKNNLATQGMKNDQVAGALQSVIDTPDEQFAPALMTTAQGLAQKGLIDPQHMQIAQQLSQLPPAQAKQQLSLFKKGYQSESQQIKSAMDSADIALKTAQQGEAAAKGEQTGRANAASQLSGAPDQMSYAQIWKQLPLNVARSFPDPGKWSAAPEFKDSLMKAGMTPDQQATLPVEKVEMNSWLKQNPGKSPADFMKYKASIVPALNFNLQNGGGGGIANTPADPQVQGVANGALKIQDVLTPRTPLSVRRQFLSAVQQVNPQFKSSDYDIEKGVAKAFTVGKPAEELVAFNTAIAHADLLKQAADALNNGDVRVLNKVGNELGVQFGSDKKTNFQIIANAYSREVTKALSAGHLTDSEISSSGATVSPDASPAQFAGAVTTYKRLMQSKIQQRQQQYKMGIQAQPNLGQPQAQGQPSTAPNPFAQFGGVPH